MSGMWRKTLVYLGLVEEPDEHDEHLGAADERGGREPAVGEHTPPARRRRPPERPAGGEGDADVRPLRPADTHVRAVGGGTVKVGVVRASSFDEAAEQVGERYRRGQPVLLDVGNVDRRTGRRLLDFVSGLIYALRGRIVPAGEEAFLLVPDGMGVPTEERHRLAELGYRVVAAAPGDT
jgi:cell division inhibitor SepF